jgi:tetratricopeptide (TPR) repeat protein
MKTLQNYFLRIVVAVLVVSLLLTACGSSRELTYRVSGNDTNKATITYTDAKGDYQKEQVDLPWETTFSISGEFDAEITVANEEPGGDVTCEISLDGDRQLGDRTSAAYARCEASLSVSRNSMRSSFTGSSVETYLGNVQKYMDEGDLDKALAEVQHASAVAPKFADVYFVMGLVYEEKEEPEIALEAYDRAIKFNPEHVGAYNNRGLIYDSMGDLEAAIADWSAAIEFDPEYVHSYHNRAVAYAALGNLEAAEADVKKVIELSDDPDQVAWAEETLEKLAPTPTPEPTPTSVPVTFAPITDFERYEHNMDCSGYNEDLLLRAFSVLYPSGSVITDCQGNPDNYVTIELFPDEAQDDASFILILGSFKNDTPEKSRYITGGTKLLNLLSNQLQAQLQGAELDIEADSISHQDNFVLYQDLTGEMEGIPILMRLALIPNFEHSQGLLFLALQKIDATPAEVFPAFDEVTRKIITSVEFSSPQPVIGDIRFATEITEDSQPVDPGDSFPPGVTTIYAVFDHANFAPDMGFSFIWYIDGEEVLRDGSIWDANPTGTSWVNVDHPDGLPAGEYDLQLLIDGEVLQTGSFAIGE